MTNIIDRIESIPYAIKKAFSGYQSANRRYQMNKIIISSLYYDLENVKGIDYSKQKGQYNKEQAMNRYYSLSDKIKKYEDENDLLKVYLDALDLMYKKVKDPELKKTIAKDGYMKEK